VRHLNIILLFLEKKIHHCDTKKYQTLQKYGNWRRGIYGTFRPSHK
jgi:hypothetical protein